MNDILRKKKLNCQQYEKNKFDKNIFEKKTSIKKTCEETLKQGKNHVGKHCSNLQCFK